MEEEGGANTEAAAEAQDEEKAADAAQSAEAAAEGAEESEAAEAAAAAKSASEIEPKGDIEARIEAFVSKWKLDERSAEALKAASAESQEAMLTGFNPGENTENVNARMMAFLRHNSRRIRQAKPGAQAAKSSAPPAIAASTENAQVEAPPDEKVYAFATEWKIAKSAIEEFRALPNDAQATVLAKFNPLTATKDVEAKFLGFVRSVMKRTSEGHRSNVVDGVPVGEGRGGRGRRRGEGGAAGDDSSPVTMVSKEQVQDFIAEHDLNEASQAVLSTLPFSVLKIVVLGFEPSLGTRSQDAKFQAYVRARLAASTAAAGRAQAENRGKGRAPRGGRSSGHRGTSAAEDWSWQAWKDGAGWSAPVGSWEDGAGWSAPVGSSPAAWEEDEWQEGPWEDHWTEDAAEAPRLRGAKGSGGAKSSGKSSKGARQDYWGDEWSGSQGAGASASNGKGTPWKPSLWKDGWAGDEDWSQWNAEPIGSSGPGSKGNASGGASQKKGSKGVGKGKDEAPSEKGGGTAQNRNLKAAVGSAPLPRSPPGLAKGQQ